LIAKVIPDPWKMNRARSLDFQSLSWMRIVVDNINHFWELENSVLSLKPERAQIGRTPWSIHERHRELER
jgi:hypothetical protein